MWQCVLRENSLHATGLLNNVVLGSNTLRNLIIWNVWYCIKHLLQLIGSGIHSVLQFGSLYLEIGNLSLNGISLIRSTGLHQLTDLCSELLVLGKDIVKLLLCRTALLVKLQNFLYCLLRILEMLLLQTLEYLFGLLADNFKCQHNILFFNILHFTVITGMLTHATSDVRHGNNYKNTTNFYFSISLWQKNHTVARQMLNNTYRTYRESVQKKGNPLQDCLIDCV